MTATRSVAHGVTHPPIDDLLDKVDSKYELVLYAAKRARQINAYYSQLGEGLLEYVGPLVETHVQEKPLSIALREINDDLLQFGVEEPASAELSAADIAAAEMDAVSDTTEDTTENTTENTAAFAEESEPAGDTED